MPQIHTVYLTRPGGKKLKGQEGWKGGRKEEGREGGREGGRKEGGRK